MICSVGVLFSLYPCALQTQETAIHRHKDTTNLKRTGDEVRIQHGYKKNKSVTGITGTLPCIQYLGLTIDETLSSNPQHKVVKGKLKLKGILIPSENFDKYSLNGNHREKLRQPQVAPFDGRKYRRNASPASERQRNVAFAKEQWGLLFPRCRTSAGSPLGGKMSRWKNFRPSNWLIE